MIHKTPLTKFIVKILESRKKQQENLRNYGQKTKPVKPIIIDMSTGLQEIPENEKPERFMPKKP